MNPFVQHNTFGETLHFVSHIMLHTINQPKEGRDKEEGENESFLVSHCRSKKELQCYQICMLKATKLFSHNNGKCPAEPNVIHHSLHMKHVNLIPP